MNKNDYTIRLERKEEYREVENLVREAFWNVYRPGCLEHYVLNQLRKDAAFVSELDFVSSQANLLSMLRDVNGCNLSGISQTTSHVLLYGYDYKGNGNQKSSKTWNVKLQSITDIKSEASTVTAQNYYDSGTQQSIVIYKDMLNERDFVKNGTYTINDKGFLEGKTIVVTDGHTLDISAIGLDVSNVKIFVSGSGTVISNPDITLKDSFVVVADTSEGDNVYFKNLNVVSGENDEAALTVKSPCTVNFEGSNSFAAVNQSGSDSSRASEIHKKYTRTRPIFASHGVLIEENTILKGADVNRSVVFVFRKPQALLPRRIAGNHQRVRNILQSFVKGVCKPGNIYTAVNITVIASRTGNCIIEYNGVINCTVFVYHRGFDDFGSVFIICGSRNAEVLHKVEVCLIRDPFTLKKNIAESFGAVGNACPVCTGS